MPDDFKYGLALGCGLPVVLLIVFVVRSFFTQRARAARKLGQMATQTIGTLTPGQLSKIVGVVGCTQPLQSKLSQRDCVAYEITVEYRSPGRSRPPKRFDFSVPEFKLEDSSGCARVSTERAVLVIEQDRRHEFEAGNAPEWTLDLLRQSGLHFERPSDLAGKIMIREGVVEVGEEIAAAGLVDTAGSHPRLIAPQGGRLQISDVAGLPSEEQT